MAHLLIVELPGGNDTDIVDAALARGDSFSFLSADLAHYRRQSAVAQRLAAAQELIEVPGFEAAELERRVLAAHERCRFDALLCLIETRLVEAARLGRRLGLRFLNPVSARLLRDKFEVRRRLRAHGFAQPPFALATVGHGLRTAVEQLGLPLIVKPADGYASQNIVALRESWEIDPVLGPIDALMPVRTDYGLGVRANDRLIVERLMQGRLVACDTFSRGGRHRLLGVHEKLMFAPPSFAIRGCTFSPAGPEFAALERWAFELLDALGFDEGAAHIEAMLTADGPRLVEVNPRLVGAKIPRLLSMALGRPVLADLIALHAGEPIAEAGAGRPAVLRWLAAEAPGRLAAVELPAWQDEAIRGVELLRAPGDIVRAPIENADRIGCVMVCGPARERAEALAERYVAETRVRVTALQEEPVALAA